MKRILIFIFCWMTLVMFLSSARAVDRSPKANDSEQKKETTEIKEGKDKRSWEVTRKTNLPSEKATEKDDNFKKVETKTTEGKDKYDYFLDRNNNGIDDRLEGNLKTKETKKSEITKKKISSPPVKTTTKTNPVVKPKEKVKPQKSAEPKKDMTPQKIEKKKRSQSR